MSMFSEAFAAAHATLATAKGESIGYRVGTSGGFTALSGFVLIIERLPAPTMDGDHEDQSTQIAAMLKGPVTPVMVRGYQVKDNVSGITFAVESCKIDSQQICRLMSVNVQKLAPDRKGAQ